MGLRLGAVGLGYSYGRRPVLTDVTFDDIAPGECVALVGPNGAGKSTLFKCLAGLATGTGDIRVDGDVPGRRELRRLQTKQITYLPQEFPVTTALTVFESVLVTARGGGWRVSSEHLDLVERALGRLDLEHLAGRYLTELSGGQRQLVSVAQAIVRRPKLLLLDEPVSNLDLYHQLSMLEQVRDIARTDGITSIIALHDLNLAARYADRVLVLHNGRITAAGSPEQVLTCGMLEDIYHVAADVHADDSGVPVVVPQRALHPSARDRAGQGQAAQHWRPLNQPAQPPGSGPPTAAPTAVDDHTATSDNRKEPTFS